MHTVSGMLVMQIINSRKDGCYIRVEGNMCELVSPSAGIAIASVDMTGMSARDIMDWILDRSDY